MRIAMMGTGTFAEPTFEALLAAFLRAQAELRVVAPRDLGVAKIGHFDLFRASFRSTWWSEARAWLLA